MKKTKVLSRKNGRTVIGMDLGNCYLLKYIYSTGVKYIKLPADERAWCIDVFNAI